MQIFHTWKNCRLADLKNHLYRLIFSTKSKTVSTNHIQLLMRLKEIPQVFSVGIEGQKFLKRWRHDVLVLIFWPNALKFKILKFPFSVAFIIIFLGGNFAQFSVHKSLEILKKQIVNFFEGYIYYLSTNQTSSQVYLI